MIWGLVLCFDMPQRFYDRNSDIFLILVDSAVFI